MAFDIEKMETILAARANGNFSGYPITLKESEIKEIITELREARRPKVMKSWE
jgi:hypothetical protein